MGHFLEIACGASLTVGLYGLVLGTFFFVFGAKGEERVIQTQSQILSDGLVTPVTAITLSVLSEASPAKHQDVLRRLRAFEPANAKPKPLSARAKQIRKNAFLMFGGIATAGVLISLILYYFSKPNRFSYARSVGSAVILLLVVFAIQTSMTFLWIARFSNVSVPATFAYVLAGISKK